MFRGTIILIGIFLLFVLVQLAIPSSVVTTLLVFTALTSIIILSVVLLFGYAGQISLGQAGFYGLGAYVSALLTGNYGVPFPIAFLASGLAAGAVGYVLGFPSIKIKGLYLALVTLAFGEIFRMGIGTFGLVTGGWAGFSKIPYASFGGLQLEPNTGFFYFVVAITFIIFLSALNLANSRVGRALRMISISELGATASGIPVTRYKTLLFALTSAYLGFAGSMLAHYSLHISPESFGSGVALMAFAGAALGGMGSIYGAVIGGVFMVLIPYYLGELFLWRPIVYAAVILVVLLFMPQGLVFSLVDAVRHRRSPLRTPYALRLLVLRARASREPAIIGSILHDATAQNEGSFEKL